MYSDFKIVISLLIASAGFSYYITFYVINPKHLRVGVCILLAIFVWVALMLLYCLIVIMLRRIFPKYFSGKIDGGFDG